MTCTRTSTTKLLLNNTASTSILSLLFECFEHRKDKWLLRWNTFIAFQFRFHMTKTNRTHSLVVCLHCVCHFMSTVVVCRIIQSKTIAFFASIVWYFFPPFLCVYFFLIYFHLTQQWLSDLLRVDLLANMIRTWRKSTISAPSLTMRRFGSKYWTLRENSM